MSINLDLVRIETVTQRGVIHNITLNVACIESIERLSDEAIRLHMVSGRQHYIPVSEQTFLESISDTGLNYKTPNLTALSGDRDTKQQGEPNDPDQSGTETDHGGTITRLPTQTPR